MIMLDTQHVGCGGRLRIARDVTEAEEAQANAREDAAILKCDRCGLRLVDDTTSSRPDRFRDKSKPDQSVFSVGGPK